MLNKLCLVPVPKQTLCAVCFVPSRSCTIDIRQLKNPQTAHLKRGTGGRSSFNGNVVTVFGANGFIGRHLCNQLGKRGCQIIIPHRSDPDLMTIKSLKLVGDLGQVLFQPFDLRDPVSIRKAIKYSNVVINLIGSYRESRNFSLDDVNVKGAREIAKACKEYNVERLIHFSALSVNEKPKRHFLKKIDFLPSKKKGEIAVMEEFPDATIFRPSVLYGFSDHFVIPLVERRRAHHFSVPLYKKGEATIRQPVFVSDVVQGVINAMNNIESRGKIYQIVGPERYYLKDIVTFCAQILQRHALTKKLVHDVFVDPSFMSKLMWYRYFVGYFEHCPFYDISLEQIEFESITDVVDCEQLYLTDLGVQPAKMEDKVPHLIFRRYQAVSDVAKNYEELLPVDSLSKKAVQFA